MVEKYENHELHAVKQEKPTEEQASPFLTSILMFNHHPDRSLYSYNCTRRTTKASSIASK